MISINKLTMGFFQDTKKYSNYMKELESKEYKELDLKEIISVPLPDNQYIKLQTPKYQIVLHHTVSGVGVDGDISWWRQTADRIGTAVIVGSDGKIYQCFSSKYWAYHLGVKTYNNTVLNQCSIGIEIDSWGGLVKHTNGKYYPAKWSDKLRRFVPNLNISAVENVVVLNKKYRGFTAFEKYTDEQIESVRKLLVYWGKKYNISLKYNEDMWDLSSDALTGKSGVWSHTSYRSDKSDCYPDERLIKMLKSLS